MNRVLGWFAFLLLVVFGSLVFLGARPGAAPAALAPIAQWLHGWVGPITGDPSSTRPIDRDRGQPPVAGTSVATREPAVPAGRPEDVGTGVAPLDLASVGRVARVEVDPLGQVTVVRESAVDQDDPAGKVFDPSAVISEPTGPGRDQDPARPSSESASAQASVGGPGAREVVAGAPLEQPPGTDIASATGPYAAHDRLASAQSGALASPSGPGRDESGVQTAAASPAAGDRIPAPVVGDPPATAGISAVADAGASPAGPLDTSAAPAPEASSQALLATDSRPTPDIAAASAPQTGAGATPERAPAASDPDLAASDPVPAATERGPGGDGGLGALAADTPPAGSRDPLPSDTERSPADGDTSPARAMPEPALADSGRAAEERGLTERALAGIRGAAANAMAAARALLGDDPPRVDLAASGEPVIRDGDPGASSGASALGGPFLAPDTRVAHVEIETQPIPVPSIGGATASADAHSTASRAVAAASPRFDRTPSAQALNDSAPSAGGDSTLATADSRSPDTGESGAQAGDRLMAALDSPLREPDRPTRVLGVREQAPSVPETPSPTPEGSSGVSLNAAISAENRARLAMVLPPDAPDPRPARSAAAREQQRSIRNFLEGKVVEFQVGRDRLTDEGRKSLDELAALIQKNTATRIVIQGHTDSVGDEASNFELSGARALAARDYLVARGIDPGRLAVQGFGESRPVASNRTAEGRIRNRRIDFAITE